MSAGILIAGSTLCSLTDTQGEQLELSTTHTHKIAPQAKHTAEKVYHRFEDIPEITDKDAILYKKSDYTYIINADIYQKTGKIELKRVLKAEVTQANALSLIYRSECGDYHPQPNEDQIVKYDIDMKLLNPSGTFKGPSQMNDAAVTSYIRFLAATPKTRQYVLPLLKYTPSKGMPATLDEALKELEKLYYDPKGRLRPMNERNTLVNNKLFTDIKLNSHAWQKIASAELKAFIDKESRKRKKGLSNTTKNYLCLTELIPSEKLLQQTLEDYNLTTYSLGRDGKPKDVMLALARSMNLKDTHGNLDATRIPTYAIAASISHINWKGNGSYALKQAQNLRNVFRLSDTAGMNALKKSAKQWVTGKSRRSGVNELAQLNMITPTLIRQYQELELAGADSLAKRYRQLVQAREEQIKMTNLAQLSAIMQKQR